MSVNSGVWAGRFLQPYARPGTIAEAVLLLGRKGVCVLAGGTDLVTMRAEGIDDSSRVVDVKAIGELSGITVGAKEISIGACTCLDELSRSAVLGQNAISDGAKLVGGWQTRLRATIGGNICRASPAADTLCGLLVLGGRLELVSKKGKRLVAASEFFTGPGRTVLRSGELLARIIFARHLGASAYQRFTYRNSMDLSVAGVAVFLELDGDRCINASVAVGACGPTPIQVPKAADALVGSTINAEAIEAAVNAVVATSSPIDDVRGTRKHRLHVLAPLTRRVTLEAFRRAAAIRGEAGS